MAEAILLEVEGVDEIRYLPQIEEFSSNFEVIMTTGVKYIVSVSPK